MTTVNEIWRTETNCLQSESIEKTVLIRCLDVAIYTFDTSIT